MLHFMLIRLRILLSFLVIPTCVWCERACLTGAQGRERRSRGGRATCIVHTLFCDLEGVRSCSIIGRDGGPGSVGPVSVNARAKQGQSETQRDHDRATVTRRGSGARVIA